ncbi:hypothetical protein MFIFM68171_06699 [Madurella fahalii]|uniref:NACHT domain-containing protein n=1 Tax=Madurella fahalii TaxID=1157608 RepID=A0ABQ0GFH6_9PEZI
MDRDDVMPGLWDEAFDGLTDADKEILGSIRQKVDASPSAIIKTVEDKRGECVKRQWVLYTNRAGEQVMVRDVLAKVCDWLNRFAAIGDGVAQFDPSHAALPWGALKTLLQMAINDCQTFGLMADSLETVAGIITRYTELETRVLIRTSSLTNQLSVALVKLYGAVLKFLAQAAKYYGQSTLKRTLKSVANSAKHMVEGRRKKLSAWINGIDTKNTYETALQYHHAGTCEWALNLAEFHAWESPGDTGPRLLWIHGPAGFGKTFLSAWIIRHLKEKKNQREPSYFFCVADNQLTRDPFAILRSWLVQQLDQPNEALLSVLERVYTSRKNEQTVTHLGLWELFRAVGSVVEDCTFVVDGFDECVDIDTGTRYHRNDPRKCFLRDLIQNLAQTKSRVPVVSRDVPDISEYLARNSVHGAGITKLEYKISAKDTAADVRSFSEFMVNARLARKTEKLRREIADTAAERSEGMFLWIKLLEQEISPGQNAKQLAKRVKEMPSGISEAYSRELDKISRLPSYEKDQAVMILQWLLFAVRPLKVKELAEALVVSADDLEDRYPEDDLPDNWHEGFVDDDYVKEMILGRCGSLLQLRSTSSDLPLADHTVHFVHFSVKEYLSNPSGDNRWALELGLADTAAQEIRLSNTCLRYLTLDTFEEVPPDTTMYPFLSYASWAWYYHSFHEKPKPPEDIMTRTQKAFDPSVASWRVWTPVMEERLMDAAVERHSSQDDDPDPESNDSGECGTNSATGNAFPKGDTGVSEAADNGANVAGGPGPGLRLQGWPLRVPSAAAVAMNRVETVKHLVSLGVDVLQTGGVYGAAIVAAAATSGDELVKVLLDAGADVKATDERGWTALHHAAKRGSVAIAQQLLERGADVDAASRNSWTAATTACCHGNRDVLLLLIKHGANLDIPGSGNPLAEAVFHDNAYILAILLDNGCGIDKSLILNGQEALKQAVKLQKPQAVGLLLKKGADPNFSNSRGWTPLHDAAATGNLEIIKTLINTGAVVTGVSDTADCAPLQVAAANGHPAAVRLLHEHGADVSQTHSGGLTAIILATENANREMIVLLLDMGASMRCIWEQAKSSLYDIAASSGNVDIAELLVRRGYFKSQQATETTGKQGPIETSSDDSNLVIMAYDGDVQGIKRLLDTLGPPLPVRVIEEALRAAAARGHLTAAKLLLRSGVRINSRDTVDRTALHYATKYLHWDVADFLIEKGADVSAEDMIGSTPIDLAVDHGMEAVGFIRANMDNFSLHISRRPSLLAAGPNQSANQLSVMGTRKAISGSWAGHHERIAWEEKMSFSIDIPAAPPPGLRPSTFSSESEDAVGKFQFHGFVDPIGTVWFVKLYERHGWLYRGQLDAEKMTLKGDLGKK